jgi:hypothetical protein
MIRGILAETFFVFPTNSAQSECFIFSHRSQCGRATGVPATDTEVAWQGTRSSDVSNTCLPPCLLLETRPIKSQPDSCNCCGLCERCSKIAVRGWPSHMQCPSRRLKQPLLRLGGCSPVTPSRLKSFVRPSGLAVAGH